MGVIAISDLHGGMYTLTRLLNAAPRGHRLVFGGDLVDRGPHSRKVVEFAVANGIPTVIGNHCDFCLAFYGHPGAHCAREYDLSYWVSHNGGGETVRNWPLSEENPPRGGWQRLADEHNGGRVPDHVLDWMAALPAYLTPSDEVDGNGLKLLLSHNGHGLSADASGPGNWFKALWARHTAFPDDGYYRVFGHSRVPKALVTERWANIDSGAAYDPATGGGTLSALIWPSKVILTQQYDETPVEPTFKIVNGCIE